MICKYEPMPICVLPPTRMCLICDKFENPEAKRANGEAWLCPECKDKIRKIIKTA